MAINKPKTDRVYVTFTNAQTRKSVTVTLYGTTHEKAKLQYEEMMKQICDADSHVGAKSARG